MAGHLDAGAQTLGRRGADIRIMREQARAQGREQSRRVRVHMTSAASQALFHEAWPLIPVKQM